MMSSYVLVVYRFGFATVFMAPVAWAVERYIHLSHSNFVNSHFKAIYYSVVKL